MSSILTILSYPDERLRLISKNVEYFGAELSLKVNKIFATHYAADNCAALAAPQVNIHERIVVIDYSKNRSMKLCLINPEIVESHGSFTDTEGCMSLDGIFAKVTRFKDIFVKYQDIEGNQHHLEAQDFLSKCIQHEIDHLNGILFIDHLTNLQKLLISNKLKKIISRNK